MKRVSLKHVANVCILKPAFFRALLRNPERALLHHKMHITKKELRRLKRLMSNRQAMNDFVRYSKLFRKYAQTPYGLLW